MMNEWNKEWTVDDWAEERMNKGWMIGKKNKLRMNEQKKE